MTKSYLICALNLLLLLASAYGVIWPEHGCKYFTYGLEDGKTYVGLFTAPETNVHDMRWNISFVWQGSSGNPVTSIEHYPSREGVIENINAGQYAQLIARFRNFNELLPKLVHLQVNDKILCSNPGYEYWVIGLDWNYIY